MTLAISDSPTSIPEDSHVAIVNQSGPGERKVSQPFGATPAWQELGSAINASAARDFVAAHRTEIRNAAKEYNIDELVLANVLYQEARHASGDDFAQDRIDAKDIPEGFGGILGGPVGAIAEHVVRDRLENGNLGPGQINIKTFKRLKDGKFDAEGHQIQAGNRVKLSPAEEKAYKADPDGFSRNFLINPETGIRATAAFISDRLTTLEDAGLIPNTGRDGDPSTLNLNQFIYGAALYSSGGRTGDQAFDRHGPDEFQISFSRNDISRVRDLPNSDKLIFSFHYLGETYEALYGRDAPMRLSDYFDPVPQDTRARPA